jgi:hypothetical protein
MYHYRISLNLLWEYNHPTTTVKYVTTHEPFNSSDESDLIITTAEDLPYEVVETLMLITLESIIFLGESYVPQVTCLSNSLVTNCYDTRHGCINL